MGVEEVEFKGGPADGLSERIEADDFTPGVQIGKLGGLHRISAKDLGCAWRAEHVSPQMTWVTPRTLDQRPHVRWINQSAG